MEPAVANNIIETATSYTASALRYTATATPPFWLMNVQRDTITAAALNPNKKQFFPFFDTLKGIYTLARDPETVSKFKVAGVRYTTKNAEVAKDLAKLTGVKTWKEATIPSLVIKALEMGNKIGQTLEEGTRIALFKQALKEGESLTTAGFRASETTVNFSRSGKVTQRANRAIPFLNAGIQGTDKFIRAFKENPVKYGLQATYYITIPSILLWQLNHEEEWYKKTPVDIKNRFWLFKVVNIVYRIPKPESTGFFFGSLYERAFEYAVDNNIDAKPSFKTVSEVVAPNLWVQAFKPLLEVIFNKNNFTNRPIENGYDLTLPPEERFDVYTSGTAKIIGNALGLSPKVLDHIGKGYFSTYYSTFTDLIDLMGGTEKDRPSKKWNEYTVINRFIHDPEKNTAYVNSFYKGLEELR